MDFTVKRRAQLSTSHWGGGSTTELFLYPPSASYEGRDFELRLSTATVEQESSRFTELPDYIRLLMPLRGEMRLSHELQYDLELRPYATDRFQGGWHTRSFGICTDLGVMYRKGWDVELDAILTPGERSCVPGFTGVYALVDGLSLSAEGDGTSAAETLDAGDFFLIEHSAGGCSVTLSGMAPEPDSALAVRFTAWRNGKD